MQLWIAYITSLLINLVCLSNLEHIAMAFYSKNCAPVYINTIGTIYEIFSQPQMIAYELANNESEDIYLMKLLEGYCICELNAQQTQRFTLNNSNSCGFCDRSSLYSKKFIPTNVKTKMLLHDSRISWLIGLLDQVYDDDTIIVKQAKKIQRKCNSSRKSSYIGVSKNGPNWQSMISVEKRKSYIGTYNTELEAAQSFDFYSLLTHGFSAKTNFSYSKNNIYDLINRFQLEFE